MSIPEKEKELSARLTKTEEEEESQEEEQLLAGVSSENCRPTEEREKEDESIIQSTEKKTQQH
jgi:hypothetical protein